MGNRLIRRLAFGAVAGRHKNNTKGACQDAVFGKTINGISCIALADGAGSKLYSGTGARKVVKKCVEIIVGNYDEIFEQVINGRQDASKKFILETLLNELKSSRFAKRVGIQEYACTLIFVAAKQDLLLLGHMGDGIAFSVEKGISKVASWPENGEYANETYFITNTNVQNKFRLSADKLEVPRSILIASDGAAISLIRNSDNKIAPAVAKLCEWTSTRSRKEMNEVLHTNLQGMFSENTLDDCSIGIMADLRTEI